MAGDVADEPAGERVARAGRVDDALEREGGQREEAARAVTSAAPYSPCLATTAPRAPALEHASRRARETRFGLPVSWRSSASLRITQSTDVDRRDQRVAGDLDPEVHRVQRDEARVGQLGAHLALQVGLDVREEQHVARARGGGELRLRSPRTRRAGCRASRASSDPSRTRRARRRSCRRRRARRRRRRRRGRAAPRARPRRSHRRPGRRRGPRRRRRRPARSARRRRRASARARRTAS